MGNGTILRKLLLSALLLIVVALGSAAIFLTRYTAASELQHAEDTMAAQARILLEQQFERQEAFDQTLGEVPTLHAKT